MMEQEHDQNRLHRCRQSEASRAAGARSIDVSLLEDATIALMDIDPERLDFPNGLSRRSCGWEYPAKLSATLDRVEALRG
jgi:hypothetical protein